MPQYFQLFGVTIFLSYLMYMVLIMLGRQKNIQQNHFEFEMVIEALKRHK